MVPTRRSIIPGLSNAIVRRCAWGLVAIAALWRIAAFVPQPLDSAGTLRPFLLRLFSAFTIQFSNPKQAEARWTYICLALVLIPPVLALLNYLVRAKIGSLLGSRALFFLSVAAALVACRFPVLLLDQLNPDEAQFLAAAQKLFVDPLFFRSVDTGTSGPLNIFPLLLPAALGVSPDFASSRLVGLAIIFISIYVLYRALGLLVDDAAARIAILPVAGIFAVLKNQDFLHYTSEHVSFLLEALAVLLCVRIFVKPERSPVLQFALGVLVSAAFFAKMQAVPVVLGVGLLGMRRGWRPIAAFLAGIASLQFVNALLCIPAGVWNDYWTSYIIANYRYNYAPAPPFRVFLDYINSAQEIHWLFAAALAAMVVLLCLRRRAPAWFAWLMAVLMGASLGAVYAPHRLFLHYLLLPVIPLCLTIAWPVAAGRAGKKTVVAFSMATMILLAILQMEPNQVAFADIRPRLRAPESEFIQSIGRQSSLMTVWGWDPNPYLGTGYAAATRDTNMANLFHPSPEVSRFYRKRFLRDIARTRPPIFVDATGASSFPGNGGLFWNRQTGGFELIPEIQSYVETNYVEVAEGYWQRYYIRRELIDGAERNIARKCHAGALLCLEGTSASFPAELPAIDLPERALVEVTLRIESSQAGDATVFSNDDGDKRPAGFQLSQIGGERYRLAIGLGSRWALSQPVLLPRHMTVALSIEFKGRAITISCNGIKREEMQLPVGMLQSGGPVTVGSWIGGQRPFQGAISFFQIRDLGAH